MTTTWPDGTRVRKSRMRPGDTHGVGALARTLGEAFGPIQHEGRMLHGYFVIWDDLPGVPVFIREDALEKVDAS